MKTMLQKLGILAAMLPVSLCASAYDFVADGIAYTITSFTEFECSVVANDSSYRGDITIPETVSFNGRTLTVKSIGDSAFYQNEALTSVTIPATVTTIGRNAFFGCVNLQTITLPDGLTDIGRLTFYGCSSIESIDLPASLTKIGYDCFSCCTALSKIKLPAAVSKLSDGCFSGCSNLKYIDLTNVETIGESAFAGCTNLAEVKFGDKLRLIGSYAFERCGFEEFTIPNNVSIGTYHTLLNCNKLQSLTIGNGITRIDMKYNDLISGCTNIKKFIIADGATALTYDNGESYKYQILYGNAPFEFVYIGRDMVSAQHGGNYYYPPFKGNTHIKTVEIGEFTTYLPCYWDYGFFENCTSLDSIKIWGLPTIPENFAKGDTALKYVEISNKTTKIESGAFDGCSSLETIVLKALTPPTYEDDFSSSVYLNCRLLIPEGTEALYKNASPWNNFWNIVESPECFTVGDLKYTIITGNDVSVSINDSTGKQNVQIPSQVEYNSTVYNVVSIAGEGFANSTELTAISLPSSIKRIGENAFQGCDNLNVVISKNPEAPITFKEVFSPNIYETATLFLPNGRESSYAADTYWRLFKNIRQSELVPIDSLKFEEKELAINLNESNRLVPHIYPDSASIQKLKWTSSAPDIVSVADDGTIASDTQKGEATITATTTDGTNISDSIIVKVGTEAGIGEVISENATISVSAENNTIVITGKPAEQIVNVYDIQGRLIATTTQDHVFIKEHGTYIVRIAHSTSKIVL